MRDRLLAMLTAGAMLVVACTSFSATTADAPADGGGPSGTGGDADADAGTDVDGGSGSGDFASEVLADKPLLYLHLDETTGTSAMNAVGPPGTVYGPVTRGVAGVRGTAIAFDGQAGERIEVDGTGLDFPDRRPFTLEAWIHLHTNDGDYRHLFTMDEYPASGRQEYGIFTNNGQIKFERIVSDMGLEVTTDLPPSAKWQHIVGTYDGMTLALYVDGVLFDSASDQRSAFTKSVPLLVGAKSTNGGVILADVDEVAVYGTALSGERVKAHFDAGRPR